MLHAASALELQREGMIKSPVDLESRRDWLEVLAATHHRREDLERVADRATEDHDLPLIRPIALIQAQSKSGARETHTFEKVKAALIEQLKVPAEYVRICTGTIDEIGDTDLMATNCPVRYVITVDKLREGWVCICGRFLPGRRASAKFDITAHSRDPKISPRRGRGRSRFSSRSAGERKFVLTVGGHAAQEDLRRWETGAGIRGPGFREDEGAKARQGEGATRRRRDKAKARQGEGTTGRGDEIARRAR